MSAEECADKQGRHATEGMRGRAPVTTRVGSREVLTPCTEERARTMSTPYADRPAAELEPGDRDEDEDEFEDEFDEFVGQG